MKIQLVIATLMSACLAVQAQDKNVTSEATALPSAEVGKAAPDFTARAYTGEDRTLSEFKGRFVVLEWINVDCPFVKKHYGAGAMQALQKDAAEKGVAWLAICSSAPGKQGHYPAEKWGTLLEDRNAAPTTVLLDPEGKVGRLYNAKTTPQMAIIDKDGILIYAGAIDNQPSFDPATLTGAENYVKKALDAALAGKSVEPATTKPYGCSVKY